MHIDDLIVVSNWSIRHRYNENKKNQLKYKTIHTWTHSTYITSYIANMVRSCPIWNLQITLNHIRSTTSYVTNISYRLSLFNDEKYKIKQ